MIQAWHTKSITGELVRFTLIGLANTGLTYVLFAVLSSRIHYSFSFTIAYVFGIFISYFLNTRITYGEKPQLRTLLAYPLVYFIQYIIGLLLLGLLVDLFKIDRLIASPVVIIVGIPITFVASRLIIKQKAFL